MSAATRFAAPDTTFLIALTRMSDSVRVAARMSTTEALAISTGTA